MPTISYGPAFLVDTDAPRGERLVVEPWLARLIGPGLERADLERLACDDPMDAPAAARACRALLSATASASAASAGAAAELDCLLDVALGIDEFRLLPALRAAPLSLLRRYDREHTHLLQPHAASYTPYAELLGVLALVPRGGTLVDLGAGSGRLIVTAALSRPDVRAIGLETVRARVALARHALRCVGARSSRGGPPRPCVVVRTLGRSRLPLPRGDVFFLFNPLAPPALASTWQDLRLLAGAGKRFVLVMKVRSRRTPHRASSPRRSR